MRGEYLVWFASFCMLAASILQVFTHVGQINASAIPRVLFMVRVETAGIQNSLSASNSNDSFPGLYSTTTNNSALGTSGGLKNYYSYGLLNACGYVDGQHAACNSSHFGMRFEPFNALLSDVPETYKQAVSNDIPSSRFKSNHASRLSLAAFWTIFLGSCFALVGFIVGLIPHRATYGAAFALALLAWFGFAIGASIWTAIFVQLRSIADTGAGIALQFGNGIVLTWVSFALVTLALMPYMIAACTYERYPSY